ncbi:TPA: helix-turn-helix domain-containing protein [Streptococcus suis]
MNRLKELRKEKKLTQEELAGEIGVSKITILRWENGERQIKPDKAQALADHFGVSVGYLLGHSNIKDQKLVELILKANSFSEETLSSDTPKFEMMVQSDDENQLLYNYKQLKKPYREQVVEFSKSMLKLQRYHDVEANISKPIE